MDETTINVPLLRKQLEWATAEHEKDLRGEFSEWNQGNWCGTACCIAGHTVLDTGWTHETVITSYGQVAYTNYVTKDGQIVEAAQAARAELGLADADALFNGGNDIYDLWHIAARLTGGEIEIPPAYQLPNIGW